MRKHLLSCLILLLPAASQAAEPIDPSTLRLGGLSRVWGIVKYRHPAMATSAVNWDAALVRTIPAVEAAGSDGDYRRAISELLGTLEDPATRVIDKETMPPAPAARLAVRLDRIDADTALVAVPSDPSTQGQPTLREDVCARLEEAARFEKVVLDVRSPSGRAPGFAFNDAISKCVSKLLGRDVTLPPVRSLTHGFYMMQGVTGGPGGGLGPWDSGLAILASGSVRGEGSRTPRLAVLVNRGSADLYPLWMGLQGAGVASVVQEGDLGPAGILVATFAIDETLSIAVRHAECLRPGGGVGFAPDAVVAASAADAALAKARELLEAAPRPRREAEASSVPFAYAAFVEKDYSETPYPDRAHRLLALFRLANVIEDFFPYRDLMDRPWHETVLDFIPRFAQAKDATDYALTVAELATRLQDSHVTLASPVLDAYFGTHRPAIRVDLVEGQTVVTEVAPALASSGARVGDVVLSVDGEPAASRRARLARYLPASTPGRLENKIDIQFLLGPTSKPAVIEVRGPDGTTRRATVPRTLEGLAPRAREGTGPTYRVLREGYGYVDLKRLAARDVEPAFEAIRGTPGLILDMRGYPAGALELVLRLSRGNVRPGFLLGTIRYEKMSAELEVEDTLSWPPPAPPGSGYDGRVAVIIDGSAQSASEHICLLIKAVTKPTFIGTPTSGANGGVTRTVLPGGIFVNFTGYAVRHADGSQLQRVGIVPDIEARPTLRGIREGRDDLLDRAVQYLRDSR